MDGAYRNDIAHTGNATGLGQVTQGTLVQTNIVLQRGLLDGVIVAMGLSLK